MSIGDAVKNLIGIDEEDGDEKITEDEVKAAKDKLKKEKKSVEKDIAAPGKHGADQVAKAQKSTTGERRFSVTNTGAFKLVLIEPKSFEECPKLVDSLKNHKPIIINLERIDTGVARKIFDFLSGATYALNGNVQKIASNIFVFAPENVDIAGGQRLTDKSRFDFTSGNDTVPQETMDPAADPDNPWR